jgi:fatty acid desaturase
MKLRFRADWRTLVWSFALMPGLVGMHFAWPALAGWLLPLSMYAAYSAAVIAHNHNHCPTFVSKTANRWFANWISFFYGFPTYGWIPTHNDNHHKFVGAEGDATVLADPNIPDRAWLALTHFFRSTRTQGPLLSRYRKRLRERSTRAWLHVWSQYATVFAGHAAAAALAITRFGGARGAWVYASALGIPAFMALWGIMFTNWVQHAACDPHSRWDHSRNFVSSWMNLFVFDNGFHTVHHAQPGLHWSLLRVAHEKIAPNVAPHLNASSIFSYAFETYVLRRLQRPSRRVAVSGRTMPPSLQSPREDAMRAASSGPS